MAVLKKSKALFWIEFAHRKTKEARVDPFVYTSRYLVQASAVVGTKRDEKHRVFAVQDGVVFRLVKMPETWAEVPSWHQRECLQTIHWLCELNAIPLAEIGA